jgi:6-methylsalicylate decarboxylase
VAAVDFHQHFWPEPFVAALARRADPPRLRGRTLELPVEPPCEIDLRVHDLHERLRVLDSHGIDRAIVSLPPTLCIEGCDDLLDAYHRGIAEVAAAARGRLVPLAAGTYLPGFAGASVSAAALVAGAEPLLAELEADGRLLFVHPGPPARLPQGAPPWWCSVVDYTAQMQAAYMAWLARDGVSHPRLAVVFAILAGGAPVQLERLASRGIEARTALHANVYLDTASYGRRSLELALSTYGVTQLLFGSDAPVLDPGPGLAALREFGDILADVVLRENAERLAGALDGDSD